MQRGTLVHGILEHEAVHGRSPTIEHIIGQLDEYPLFVNDYLPKHGNDKRRLADWLLQIACYASPFMPEDPVPHTYVERGFTLNDPDLPVGIVGYIDLLEPDNRGVTDHKVRSTGRYAFTEEDLKEDPQAALYGAVVQAIHDADPSATKHTSRGFMTQLDGPKFADGYFRHLNLCIKESQGLQVRLDYTANEARERYRKHVAEPIREMFEVSKITDPRELTANPKACKMYGRTCPHYNLCAQAGHVEQREIDLIMGIDILGFANSLKKNTQGDPEPAGMTGINPPGGVDPHEKARPDEYTADYAAKGPYFPDGERMSGLRKAELRGAVAGLYEQLTGEQKEVYNRLCSVGEAFSDSSSKVADLRAAAVAMIRAWAGNDETKCRRCAVDPLEVEPEPEQPKTPEPEQPKTPEATLNQRLALVGCHISTEPMTDFRQWSAPMREQICAAMDVEDLGDKEFAKGYKAFAAALRNASRDDSSSLPKVIYVDPLDPLVPHLTSWLDMHYLVIRR